VPRGPKGEKRPADVIGNAVHVMRIATGEIEEDTGKAPSASQGRAQRREGESPSSYPPAAVRNRPSGWQVAFS
jgi:hypothetical protein